MEEKIHVTVELPSVFVPLVGVSAKALPAEIEKLLALELVRQGKLTYTRAAELLGTSQAEFMIWLGSRQISIFQFTPDELREEIEL